MRRDQVLVRWMDSLREGIEALGPDTPAGARTVETLAFIEFLHQETPAIFERWHARRDALRADADT